MHFMEFKRNLEVLADRLPVVRNLYLCYIHVHLILKKKYISLQAFPWFCTSNKILRDGALKLSSSLTLKDALLGQFTRDASCNPLAFIERCIEKDKATGFCLLKAFSTLYSHCIHVGVDHTLYYAVC